MIYVAILIINILVLPIFKTDNKYWISVPLWMLLVAAFIFWRIDSDSKIAEQEVQYRNTANKAVYEFQAWDNISNLKKQHQQLNMIFINAAWLQTLLTFVFQITGYRKTKRKLYRWTKTIFLVLLVAISVLIVMMGIVPTGGIVS